jgi:hypothetical protein
VYANISKVSLLLRKNDVELFASMYTYRKTALRAYSYGVVAELHRASRTPRAIEIYIGIDRGRQILKLRDGRRGVDAGGKENGSSRSHF